MLDDTNSTKTKMGSHCLSCLLLHETNHFHFLTDYISKTRLTRYIYVCDLQILDNIIIIIIKSDVFLPQTLADFGHTVYALWIACSQRLLN